MSANRAGPLLHLETAIACPSALPRATGRCPRRRGTRRISRIGPGAKRYRALCYDREEGTECFLCGSAATPALPGADKQHCRPSRSAIRQTLGSRRAPRRRVIGRVLRGRPRSVLVSAVAAPEHGREVLDLSVAGGDRTQPKPAGSPERTVEFSHRGSVIVEETTYFRTRFR